MTPAQIDESIYLTAIKNGFTDTSARFIVAQGRLESADYTSNVFKNNANVYGMKFIAQPLATRGTIAPINERSAKCRNTGVCNNSDHYAKYNNVSDSANDVITRLYAITRNGITSKQLKEAKTPIEFSTLLKQRGYFGVTASQYARGLTSKLKKINLPQTLPVVTITAEKKNNLIYYLAGIIAIFIFGKLLKSK